MEIKGSKNQNRSNITSSIGFRIDDSAKAFIIQLLSSRMYSKPESAFVRELITNALDANIDAGVSGHGTVRIELKRENPEDGNNLILQFSDAGNGMSPEVISDVFCSLGTSSRRGDNSKHGGFGIGAMSIYAVSSQAYLETVSDGIKYKYLLFLSADGLPALSLLHQDTAQSNEFGTKVSVPIDRTKGLPALLAIFFFCYHIDNLAFDLDLAANRTAGFFSDCNQIAECIYLSFQKFKNYRVLGEGFSYGLTVSDPENWGSAAGQSIDSIPGENSCWNQVLSSLKPMTIAMKGLQSGQFNPDYNEAIDGLFSHRFLSRSRVLVLVCAGDIPYPIRVNSVLINAVIDQYLKLGQLNPELILLQSFVSRLLEACDNSRTSIDITTSYLTFGPYLRLEFPIGEMALPSHREEISNSQENIVLIVKRLVQASIEIALSFKNFLSKGDINLFFRLNLYVQWHHHRLRDERHYSWFNSDTERNIGLILSRLSLTSLVVRRLFVPLSGGNRKVEKQSSVWLDIISDLEFCSSDTGTFPSGVGREVANILRSQSIRGGFSKNMTLLIVIDPRAREADKDRVSYYSSSIEPMLKKMEPQIPIQECLITFFNSDQDACFPVGDVEYINPVESVKNHVSFKTIVLRPETSFPKVKTPEQKLEIKIRKVVEKDKEKLSSLSCLYFSDFSGLYDSVGLDINRATIWCNQTDSIFDHFAEDTLFWELNVLDPRRLPGESVEAIVKLSLISRELDFHRPVAIVTRDFFKILERNRIGYPEPSMFVDKLTPLLIDFMEAFIPEYFELGFLPGHDLTKLKSSTIQINYKSKEREVQNSCLDSLRLLSEGVFKQFSPNKIEKIRSLIARYHTLSFLLNSGGSISRSKNSATKTSDRFGDLGLSPLSYQIVSKFSDLRSANAATPLSSDLDFSQTIDWLLSEWTSRLPVLSFVQERSWSNSDLELLESSLKQLLPLVKTSDK